MIRSRSSEFDGIFVLVIVIYFEFVCILQQAGFLLDLLLNLTKSGYLVRVQIFQRCLGSNRVSSVSIILFGALCILSVVWHLCSRVFSERSGLRYEQYKRSRVVAYVFIVGFVMSFLASSVVGRRVESDIQLHFQPAILQLSILSRHKKKEWVFFKIILLLIFIY